MSQRPRPGGPDVGESAWAYNRWPTIGLYTGAGVGCLLGVLFRAGWLVLAGATAAGAAGGCLLGVLLARVIYPDPGRPDEEAFAENGEPPAGTPPEPPT